MASILLVSGMALPAHAGFVIEAGATHATEKGSIAQQYQPYEPEAKASFRHSAPTMDPRQERFKDAELLVDLAYRPVTQRGAGQAEVVEGFGEGMPFDVGMSMILPLGWQLYKDRSLKEQPLTSPATPQQITFTGGKPWPDVLADLGDRYALKFHIDWYDRTVMMSKGRPGVAYHAANIRTIAEPPRPAPVAAASTLSAAAAAPARPGAQAFAVITSKAAQPGSSTASPAPAAKASPAPIASPSPAQAPVAPKPVDKAAWLKAKRITVSFDNASGPASAATVVGKLREQGLRVRTSLGLEGYPYAGHGVRSVDGETALRQLLAPMGLDYALVEQGVVEIMPSPTRTHYISSNSGQAQEISPQAWDRLEKDIDASLVMCLPKDIKSPFDCQNQKVGSYAINRGAGAVSLSAPHWVQDIVGKHLERARSQSNGGSASSLVKGTVKRNL